jgi:hypothetical protein
MNISVSQAEDDIDAVTAARQKRLLRLVYIMGIILVLLFIGLVGGIIWKAQMGKKQTTVMPAASLDIGVKADDIRSTSLSGDRLVVTTIKEIMIIDVAKSKVLLRLPLQ